MSSMNTTTVMKLMVTIVDRGKRDQVIKVLDHEQLHFHYQMFGLGTASSEILDYLGIGESKKDIIFSIAPSFKTERAAQKLSYELQLEKPGHGILFTIPLSGISSKVSKAICEVCEQESGDKYMNQVQKNELILVIVNQGYVDQVMDAAKVAGARGGTVIHGRGIGHEEAQKFLGLSIQSEKEIIMILVPKEIKASVMQEVSTAAGLHTEAMGVLLSLPVESMIGLKSVE